MTKHGPIPADGPGRLRVGERVKCRCGCGADLIGTHLGWLKDFKVSDTPFSGPEGISGHSGTPDPPNHKEIA